MRVADKMSFTQVDSALSRNRTDMTEFQGQASSQKRVNRPSDDPIAATRVLALKTDERVQQQFIKSTNIAKGFLEATDQTLGELTETLSRAKELAIGQSNDASANETSRKAVAAEVDQLLFQSIQIGNRKMGDRYLFGGHKTTTSPFDQEGKYHGDKGDIKIQVAKDTFVAMNIPGSKVFLGKDLNLDGVARARIETPRTSSDLEIYKSDKELSDKESLEHSQKTSNVLASGDQRLSRNIASIPDQEESENHLSNPSESTWHTDGVDVFQTLKSLTVALKTNDKEGIQSNLDVLDAAIAQVVLARSQVGARVMSLNNAQETLQKSIVELKQGASQLEDADLFQLVSDINKTDSALKATMQTSGKLIQPSLLDFLR